MDSDFNVGISSEEGLEKLIEKERKSEVALTVLGYGMGNYKDNKIQILAEKGNGNHAYIDDLQEANRVLVGEFGATLYMVAKDVKLQVEFNPSQVQSYRLVGYESRLLRDEDFNNDSKDAGDLGAGHTVTVFYEVIPIGVSNDYVGKIDDFRCASSVAMFGQLLRDSDFKGEADYDQVIHLAKLGLANDEHGYRKEFVRLVELVKGISAQE